MLDIGVSKLAIIGAIALVVIGPERLPGVARTLGTLLGRARSYVADVKAEVNRSMELDALKKMRESVESAARDVESTIQTQASDFDQAWKETTMEAVAASAESGPQYRHPGKKWRLRQAAVPRWYKARAGVRTMAQSGAARVARFRPPKTS
ncbi:MAG: Sec-independent protein translocase protein TatB [Rhodoferax sp.]